MARPFTAYRGDQPRVFVCYSHADSDLAHPELMRLERSGLGSQLRLPKRLSSSDSGPMCNGR